MSAKWLLKKRDAGQRFDFCIGRQSRCWGNNLSDDEDIAIVFYAGHETAINTLANAFPKARKIAKDDGPVAQQLQIPRYGQASQ